MQLKKEMWQPQDSRAPFAWLSDLLHKHVDTFVQDHEHELMTNCDQIGSDQNLAAFVRTEFCDKLPFAKSEPSYSAKPLLSDNHFYNKDRRVTSEHRINVEKQKIEFDTGYRQTCMEVIELEDIWIALFAPHMDSDPRSMGDALRMAHIAPAVNNQSDQTQLALYLVHLYRAQALENNKPHCNAYRRALATLLKKSFHTLFQALVLDENNPFNHQGQRASRLLNFWLGELVLSLTWLIPRIIYYSRYNVHPEAEIRDFVLPGVIHLSHLRLEYALKDSRNIYDRIVSALHVAYLLFDFTDNNLLEDRMRGSLAAAMPMDMSWLALCFVAVHFFTLQAISMGPKRMGMDLVLITVMSLLHFADVKYQVTQAQRKEWFRRGFELAGPNFWSETLAFGMGVDVANFLVGNRQEENRLWTASALTRKRHPDAKELIPTMEYMFTVLKERANHTHIYMTEPDLDDFKVFLDIRAEIGIAAYNNLSMTRDGMVGAIAVLINPEKAMRTFTQLIKATKFIDALCSKEGTDTALSAFYVVDTNATVDVLQKYTPTLFQQLLQYFRFDLLQERAPNIIRYVYKFPQAKYAIMEKCAQAGCMFALPMPEPSFWTDGELDDRQFNAVNMDTALISHMRREDFSAMKAAMDGYIRTHVHADIPLELRLDAYHSKNIKQNSTHAQNRSLSRNVTNMQDLQRYMLPAVVYTTAAYTPAHQNPYATLKTWLPHLKPGNVGPDEVHMYWRVFTVAFLYIRDHPGLKELMGQFHALAVKARWHAVLDPFWMYNSVSISSFDFELWEWTQGNASAAALNSSSSCIPPLVTTQELAGAEKIIQMLHRQPGMRTADQIEQSLMQQEISLKNPQLRAYLKLPSEPGEFRQESRLSYARAIFMASNGMLPVAIPFDLSDSREKRAVRQLISHTPNVFAMQLMKLLISQALLQYSHLHGSWARTQALNLQHPHTLAVEAAKTKLSDWIQRAKNDFIIPWSVMVQQIYIVYNYLQLHNALQISEPQFDRVDWIPHHDSEISKHISIWKELEPQLFEHIQETLLKINTGDSAALNEVAKHVQAGFWAMLKVAFVAYRDEHQMPV